MIYRMLNRYQLHHKTDYLNKVQSFNAMMYRVNNVNTIKAMLIVTLSILSPLLLGEASAQTEVNVTETVPCFLNYTAGVDMWRNCGYDTDFMSATLLPFEWVTGGLLSMIVVTLIIIISYMKYRTIIYPIAIGFIMLPTSYFLFPDVFLSYAFVMAFVSIGLLIWYIIIRQTKEY